MRIVFFGTPDFAVPSLQALVEHGDDIVAVVTQPDRPQGRSRSTLVSPPVKALAVPREIPVFQPERPTGDVFLASIRRLAPDLGVVVAYGHILKPALLKIPRRGMINVHASILPDLRGAAPIQWAIVNGFVRTGITIMEMEAGLDTGPILHQVETPIGPGETGGALTERLAVLGAKALVDTLDFMRRGTLRPTPQEHTRANYAPKIDRTTTRIDWELEPDTIVRRIRAFDPAPGAWTVLDSLEIKLFSARLADGRGRPGEVLGIEPTLVVAAGRGAVEIGEVKPTGKKRMSAEDWVRGRTVSSGRRFT